MIKGRVQLSFYFGTLEVFTLLGQDARVRLRVDESMPFVKRGPFRSRNDCVKGGRTGETAGPGRCLLTQF